MDTDAGFYVASGPKGLGVYAARTFHPGDHLLTFSGPLIDFEGTLRLGEREGDALQIGPNVYIHLTRPGLLVNHACLPNAGVVQDTQLIALSVIRPHNEICFDYSTTMGDGHWTMDCICGEPTCRGRILDFHTLPSALRHAYLKLGIVQTFLASGDYVSGDSPPAAALTTGASSSSISDAK